MDKWEYALLNLLKSYGMIYRVNGEKQNQWKDEPLHRAFSDLGRAGFEFCGFDGENYIFKRPRRSNSEQNTPSSGFD